LTWKKAPGTSPTAQVIVNTVLEFPVLGETFIGTLILPVMPGSVVPSKR
jgi:hypothetical protein